MNYSNTKTSPIFVDDEDKDSSLSNVYADTDEPWNVYILHSL